QSTSVLETWSKMPSSEKVVALELDPSHENSAGRSGLWIFGGDLFLRVVGVPRGEGIIGSHCCRSLAQLEAFHGEQ
ncbi:unnamed protein product, partial [Effrenium voratum]